MENEPQQLTSALVLIAYMAILLGVGVWAARKASSSEEEFLLGGRSLGPIVSGLAYAASTSSAWVLLGFTGFVASVGVSALWMVPGILAGYAAVWFGLGPWLARVSREKNCLTALDMIASGVEPEMQKIIKMIASLMVLFCFSFYIAAQFQGAGTAISEVFAIDLWFAVVMGAGVILAYTFLGGFLAVSLTDTLQGLSIALIAIILPFVVFNVAGGIDDVVAGLEKQPPALSSPMGVYNGWSAIGFLFGISAVGFGALGQPHLLTWIMAVKDRKSRIQGGGIAIFWGALVYAGMAIVALSMRAITPVGESVGETIIFDAAQNFLPGFLPALVYAAILSAIMSTVDSQLLVASASASRDLGLGKLAPSHEVFTTRIIIIGLCVAAVGLTLFLPSTIFARVLFAWTALGAAFGPILIAFAFGRNPSGKTVLLAMVCGFVMTIYFNQFSDASPGSWKERILPWIASFSILLFSPFKNSDKSKESE